MRTREEAKKRRDAKCRHFGGMQYHICKSNINYPANVDVCFGQAEEYQCEKYSPLTAEELAIQEAEAQRHMDLMRKGLSGCCEAPFDTSQVITYGRFKNHGPRFCSKCKRLCFMV